MADDPSDKTGSRNGGYDKGKAATEKALAELKAARILSPEIRLAEARRGIKSALVKLILGILIGAGLGWLYWNTESRWAFFGAAIFGLGPVLGALRKLYKLSGEFKAAGSGE